MAKQAWSRVNARTAAEICQTLKLPEAAQPLLEGEPTPPQFLERLVHQGELLAALRFLAHALPRREAVWWACLCQDLAAGTNLPAPEQPALLAAVRWVLEPTEGNRRLARALGRAAGPITAAGSIALAAFASGGSLNPPDQPIKPPPPTMTARGVSRAILRLVGLVDAGSQDVVVRQFLALGTGIASGNYRWQAHQGKRS